MPTTPTSNVPLAFAVRSNDFVHLYILIYAGVSRPGFPPNGKRADATMVFNIGDSNSTGTSPHFEYYQVDITEAGKPDITDIEINYGKHIRKLEVIDLQRDNNWTVNGKQAFEAPYAYTQKVDADNFKVDMVIFSKTKKNFKYKAPSTSGNNTLSEIDTNGPTPEFDLYERHSFRVDNFMATNGAHEVSYAGPPNRRTKTKNKNHSQTPFPRLIRPKKAL